MKKKKAVKKKVVSKKPASMLDALCAIYDISPVIKKLDRITNDLDDIYDRYIRALKNTKDVEILGESMKILLSYKKQLSNNPMLLIRAVQNMTEEERAMARAIAKETRLVKSVAKEKDPRMLFGK